MCIRDSAFGSSTILVSIEAIRRGEGQYEAYANFGRERTGVDVFEWAERAVELGAGELMVTSIDREGTGKGFDMELTRRIAERVPVPVIAAGGAGRVEDVLTVIQEGKADAVALASILHYHVCHKRMADPVDYSDEGNTEFLKRGLGFSRIQGADIHEIKSFLLKENVTCRMTEDNSGTAARGQEACYA